MTFDSKIYDSIVVSSCLFGSIYLFTNSLKLMNESALSGKNVGTMNVINSFTCVISGSMFIYGVVRFRHITK
jgi:hypothetical protein